METLTPDEIVARDSAEIFGIPISGPAEPAQTEPNRLTLESSKATNQTETNP